MSTVLLDTHTVVWWSVDPARLSRAADLAIEVADEIAVCGITWYELAWLVRRGRIEPPIPSERWLTDLASTLRTVEVTPRVALAAAALPASFPRDPADRLIYATAIEHGWPLVTKDRRLREHGDPAGVTVW